MTERDWKSDPITGELVLDDDIVMVGGIDSIRQDLEERFGYARGEWFLDPQDPEALPVFENILLRNPNLAAIRSLYERLALATPGVKAILALTVSLDNATRRLIVRWTASTDLGEISGTTPLPVGG